MKSHWRFFVAPALGVIAVGGFHPFELWFMPLLSLVLVLMLAQSRRFTDRLLIFYLYGLGFLGPLLHWSSTYVGSFPWILLTISFATFFMVLALGYREQQIQPFLVAAAFVIGEGLRALLPFGGFGWGRFGFSQLDGPLQVWLRLGGVALTGFVLAYTAALIARVNRYSFFALPILLSSSLLIPPATAAPEPEFQSTPVRIGLVQGGVSQLGLNFNATPQEVFDRHIAVTEELLEQESVDLILWPENASDIDPTSNMILKARINELASIHSTPLVIGAVTQSALGPENVSLLFDGGAEVVSRYQKRDLVPFGEYIPLRSIAERFSSLTDSVRDFVAGREIVAHSVGGITFAPLICYEILDDRVTYENLEFSNVGVVQTNNATFGRSWQSGQQFQMTRVRAYESRVPFVVAATTGDTALIGPDGNILSRLTKFDPGFLVVEVPPSKPQIPALPPELTLALSGLFLTVTRFVSLKRWKTKILGWMR